MQKSPRQHRLPGIFLYQNQLEKDVSIDIFNSFIYYKLDYVNK